MSAWQSCTHPDGIDVDFPASWRHNEGDVLPECSAFHPDEFEVPEAQEFFDVAVLLRVEPVAFSVVAEADDGIGQRELERREVTLSGRDAVRVETVSTGEALLPEGVRATRWMVRFARDATLIAATHDVADLDYDRNVTVLDAMMERLQMTGG